MLAYTNSLDPYSKCVCFSLHYRLCRMSVLCIPSRQVPENLFYSLWDYFRQNIYMSVYDILLTCAYRWTERDMICPRTKRHGIVKIWMSFHHETTGFVIKYSESKPLVRNSRHVRKKILLFNDVSCFVTTITIHRSSFPCFVSISKFSLPPLKALAVGF